MKIDNGVESMSKLYDGKILSDEEIEEEFEKDLRSRGRHDYFERQGALFWPLFIAVVAFLVIMLRG